MTQTALEKEMKERVGEFDIISLIRLLQCMGYGPRQIWFSGKNTLCSQSRVIDGIKFYQNGETRRVVITLSIGLLAAQSPLPGYFRRILESELTSAALFSQFIRFFDNQLLRDFVCALYPELAHFFRGTTFFLASESLKIMDLRSVSALHLLFSRAFPEARVEVTKGSLTRDLPAEHIQLGASVLGRSVFGHLTPIPVGGRRVTLYLEEEETETRKPWPEEARHRLRRLIFPLLAPLDLALVIDLVLETQSRWVKLHPQSCLGYDTIRTDTPGPRKVCLFRGQVVGKGA
ncbi:MAG: hypothetical protein MI742_12680 [Desulfobacterales bacterium]|nr:hypothetical protein [Desulfobacterales bacterium]